MSRVRVRCSDRRKGQEIPVHTYYLRKWLEELSTLSEAVGPITVIGGRVSVQYPGHAFFAQEYIYVFTFFKIPLLPFLINTHFIENECGRISEESILSSSIQSFSPKLAPVVRAPFIVGFGRGEGRLQTPGAVCNKAPSALTQRRYDDPWPFADKVTGWASAHQTGPPCVSVTLHNHAIAMASDPTIYFYFSSALFHGALQIAHGKKQG